MIIETKFNIGDYIYFGNDTHCHKGHIDDMTIVIIDKDYFVRYKIDTMFNILPRLITNKDDRYINLDESRIYSNPNELLQKQIKNYEKQIEQMKNKIEELKRELTNGKSTSSIS